VRGKEFGCCSVQQAEEFCILCLEAALWRNFDNIRRDALGRKVTS
jgi:hypothetical protein